MRALFCVLVLICDLRLILSTRLNEFIAHYESVTLDRLPIQDGHSRVRRWIRNGDRGQPEPTIRFQFSAYGLHFNVTLRRDFDVFGEHFELDLGNETERFARNEHLFVGELEGEPGSRIFGTIRDGVFDGKIVTSKDTFYVESSHKYFDKDMSGTSIVYKQRDVDVLGILQNSTYPNKIPCGVTEAHEKLTRVHESTSVAEDVATLTHVHSTLNEAEEESQSTYSLAREFSRRTKRQADSKSSKKNTCTLFIRTDPMLWRYISKQEGMDRALTTEEILSVIGQHVKAANEIFSNSLFEGDKATHRNIQFVVRRVKIDTDEECHEQAKPPNPYCIENIDVSNFLDLSSRSNHDDFCLSYVFTYRDFSGGVVGLAWVASAERSGAAGGVCEKYSAFADFNSKRSLNTGIVTFLNYNRRLPPRVSHLTFTHELGHNFGSPHDSTDGDCQPGGKLGNYIMYASSTNGYLHNNDKFSPCSIKHIGLVLDQMFSDSAKKRNCFEASESTFCGNQIVEMGEECDCGYHTGECTDRCCHPRKIGGQHNVLGSGHPNPQACKRVPGASCSPSEGPCCETDCRFSPSSQHQLKLCQMETECTVSAFCSGTSAQCPKPVPKPSNLTLCNNRTQVCIDGECRGSLCNKYGYVECHLQREQYPDKNTLCELACLDESGKCVSIESLNVDGMNHTVKLPPGSPCDNFRGYCDIFKRCRAVDAQGPLLRLTTMFFNKGTYRNAVEWVEGNPWWSAAILGVFIVLMALFVKCCAVHTPSNNPNLPQHLKFYETLQRPIKTLQRRKTPGADPTQPAVAYEMGPTRGRRKPGARPLPSERASMAPYH